VWSPLPLLRGVPAITHGDSDWGHCHYGTKIVMGIGMRAVDLGARGSHRIAPAPIILFTNQRE